MASNSAIDSSIPTPPSGYRLLEKGERTQPGDLMWIDGPTACVINDGGTPYWTKFAPSLKPRPLDWPVVVGKRDHYCRAIDEKMVDPTIEIFEGESINLLTGKRLHTVN